MAEAVVKVSWDAGWNVMTVDVIGSGKPVIVVDTRKFSGPMAVRAKAYGTEVRVTRAAAIGRDRKSGKEASPAEKWDAVNRMAAHMTSGTDQWNAERSERIGLDETVLSQAMALAFPQRTAEEIRAKVTQSTPVQRLEIRNDQRVAPHYNAILRDLGGGEKAEAALAGW